MWPISLPQMGRLGALCAAALVILVPWGMWQRFEDPPGTALVKFALAGTFGVGEESRSVLRTVVDAYGQLTPRQWAQSRWRALRTLFGAEPPSLIASMWLVPMDAGGRARLSDCIFVFPSLRVAGLGFIVLAAWAARYACGRGAFPPGGVVGARWIGLGMGGIALNWVATWHMHVIHHQSYLSLLLVVAGLFAVILVTPGWIRWPLIGVHFAYFAVVWVGSPLWASGVRLDQLAGWLLAGLGLILVASATRDTSGLETAAVIPQAASSDRVTGPRLGSRATRRKR
jgi:hypothetical protein